MRGFHIGASTPPGGDALESDILLGKTAYAAGKELVGTMPNNGAINTKITSLNQTEYIPIGYHDGNGTISISTTDQGKLIATNIRKNVTILGVNGSLVEGTDTSDATVTAGDMLSGKTAYAKGTKVTGSIASKAATTITPSASSQTAVSAGTYCSGNITVGAIPNQVAAKTVTPSASAQTAVNAGSYTTGAITLGAIPNQTVGGAKYATTSAQTIATAGKYITSNITLGALSQSNLASANILRGKTITISNGSTNVWSVSGSNNILRKVSAGVTTSTTQRAFFKNDTDSETMYVSTINPGITPVFVFWYGYNAYTIGCRNGSTAWNVFNFRDNVGRWNIYVNNNKNSAWRFTSTAVDVPACYSGQWQAIYVFGY